MIFENTKHETIKLSEVYNMLGNIGTLKELDDLNVDLMTVGSILNKERYEKSKYEVGNTEDKGKLKENTLLELVNNKSKFSENELIKYLEQIEDVRLGVYQTVWEMEKRK